MHNNLYSLIYEVLGRLGWVVLKAGIERKRMESIRADSSVTNRIKTVFYASKKADMVQNSVVFLIHVH